MRRENRKTRIGPSVSKKDYVGRGLEQSLPVTWKKSYGSTPSGLRRRWHRKGGIGGQSSGGDGDGGRREPMKQDGAGHRGAQLL